VASHLSSRVPLALVDNTMLFLVVLAEFDMTSVSHSVNGELADVVFSFSFDQVILNFKFLKDHGVILAILLVETTPDISFAFTFSAMRRGRRNLISWHCRWIL